MKLVEAPGEIFACDCSLCSKRGMLWAHYDEGDVYTDGFTEGYAWGSETLSFHHCPKCGCTTHWLPAAKRGGRVGINARLIVGFEEEGGASTSAYSFSGKPVDVKLVTGANG
jgi:hypothetical protein